MQGSPMVLQHTATRDGKLLTFLRRELGLSNGLMKRLKYQDSYHVNGVPAHTNHPVKAGDSITVRITENAHHIHAEQGDLDILFEDEAIIALDKPAGMIIHPTFNRVEGTLANRLLGYYQRTGQPSAIHLVSRLDRDTAGVVLIAKNAHMHAILCDNMQTHTIQKTYLASVWKHPETDSGEINLPIARLSPTSLLRCVREDGKPAISQYHVLERSEHTTLLRLHPQTGRTHQLRVHCAHMGFPILGDVQYGTAESQVFSLAQGINHQQLLAAAITFPHPLTGIETTVRSTMTVKLPL